MDDLTIVDVSRKVYFYKYIEIHLLGDTMKYYVYLIECFETGKLYVGYTGKTISERFHKHCTNASYGVKSHLYSAMRKYGIGDFSIKELWSGKSKAKALEMEKYYIDHFNTFKEGYNQTLGGDGGWSVTDKEDWLAKKRQAVSGEKNPRYIDIEDNELLKLAYGYYERHGSIPLSYWFKHCGEMGLPKSYTKFRFAEYGGGRSGFKNALILKYGLNEESFRYTMTEEHRKKLADATRKNNAIKDN